MKYKIIIVGAFHEIIELAEENDFEIVGLIDNYKAGKYRSYPIFCNDHGAEILTEDLKGIPLIISPDLPSLRKEIVNYYATMKFQFASLVSKKSFISKSAVVGQGVVIQSNTNISAEARVGDFVKLNTFCNVMHDVIIGQYSTIAPNAVLLGKVRIGDRCYIGANATILPNIKICDDVIVGAGAVVTANIVRPGTYVGIPAKGLFR